MSKLLANKSILETIKQFIVQHLNLYSDGDCLYILKGLKTLVNYNITVDRTQPVVSLEQFQNFLSKINEKEQRRRDEGVYYTPKDITEYVVLNAFVNYSNRQNKNVHSISTCINDCLLPNNSKLRKAKIFDPTCGTAEFLLSAVNLKLSLLGVSDDSEKIAILSTIYGNDIAEESVLLSKIRLFFSILSCLENKKYAEKLSKILNKNFTTLDFVVNDSCFPQFDIIVGNPPYVEYNKLRVKPTTKFGNTYADVLKNSINSLRTNGVIGFVIPLSFVSTPRMKGIRDFCYSNLSKLFVLNFADRPDCLFDGVHQKLTIIFGSKGNVDCRVFSSSYYHWYADERNKLLDKLSVLPVKCFEQYIPKIGNKYEESIFSKLVNTKGITLTEISREMTGGSSIYLNMRGCFWTKAFSFNPGSNEYKPFACPVDMQKYLVALLNSNLFFLYWTIVSDCWHITSKEINGFKIPIDRVDFTIFEEIVNKLENKLEETKKYIGSKQTEYEYKHKDCKNEIDAIDIALQNIYKLTDNEVAYLREYKLKYRTSNG